MTSTGTGRAQAPQAAPMVRQGRGLTSAGPPLLLAGVCFALYPALRPFSDEKSLDGARAFASTRWLLARSLGIAAFILLAVGLFAVYEHIQDTMARCTARSGLLLFVGAAVAPWPVRDGLLLCQRGACPRAKSFSSVRVLPGDSHEAATDGRDKRLASRGCGVMVAAAGQEAGAAGVLAVAGCMVPLRAEDDWQFGQAS
jgi:hypothetical protein